MSDYGISATLNTSFADTVERTRTALAEQGFGISHRDRCRRHHETKLDIDMTPYLILGAPGHWHRSVDRSANVVVRSVDDTRTLVEAMNPDVMVSATGNPALASIAEDARTRLTAALAALTARATT